MKACGARTRSGGRCKRPGNGAGGRCSLHGGKSLTGVASPTFKSGRYSKYLPQNLLGRYHEAAGDPELLAGREEVALLDVRIAAALKGLALGESGAQWTAVRAAFDAFRLANAREDLDQAREALTALGALITRGAADAQAWAEIGDLIERRSRLVERETKRLVTLQQFVTVEKAMVLVRLLMDSVRQHVSDPLALAAIAADVRTAVARSDGAGAGTDGSGGAGAEAGVGRGDSAAL